MLRVAAYTGGVDVPSARFRVRAYLPHLANAGIAVTEFPARSGTYPAGAAWRRSFWFGRRLAEALAGAPRSRRYDLVLFQRELLSTFVTAEPLYGRPRLLDVDDAIWLHRRGSFALRLAQRCDAVICGNRYLVDYFSAAGRETYLLPTGVDTERFVPKAPTVTDRPIIGWSGSSANLRYLEALDGALAAIFKRRPHARLRVISDRAPRFDRVPAGAVDYVPWSPSVEVVALQDLSLGLMPLADSEWARGKCAFKMLTYMACGVPVVVSPVGVNAEILRTANVGFGAQASDEWVGAIEVLLGDQGLAAQMGRTGRELVESSYSISALAPRLAAILKQVAAVRA